MLGNRVRETANAPGTGTTINLIGPTTGYVGFVATFGSGGAVYYAITDGSQTEIQVGTVTSGSPNTLSRGTPLWTSVHGVTSPSRLNFTGSVVVYNVLPAQKAVFLDTNNGLSLPGVLWASGGAGMAGDLSIAKAIPTIHLNRSAAGQPANIVSYVNGSTRWALSLGDDSASDLFILRRHNDSGVHVGNTLYASRATGHIFLENHITVPGTVFTSTLAVTSGGDAIVQLETTAASEGRYRRKMILTSPNVEAGDGWLLRSIRPSDGAFLDYALGGPSGNIWHSGIVSQNRFVKAWINGNGATMQIRDHYNVSSLTDVGNSLFDVNFAVPLANANYAVTATMTQAADGSWGINIAANGINVAPMRMDANGIRLAAVDPHTFGAVFFGS
jgi:hypothetical protein